MLTRRCPSSTSGGSKAISLWLKLIACVGLTALGSSLIVSGGSILKAANDTLFGATDAPAGGSQTGTGFSVTAVDRAIQENNRIVSLLGDDTYAIESHRPVFVENEYWGVSAILRLDHAKTLDGPWVTVDTDALFENVKTTPVEAYTANPNVQVNELMDESDANGAATIELSARDYVTTTDSYSVTTERLIVSINPSTGNLLTLVPYAPPPNLWDDDEGVNDPVG